MDRSAQFRSVAQQPTFVSLPHRTSARDVSFSSYLQPRLNNPQVDDSEISIFDAQKYFNETNASTDPRIGTRISPVEVISLESVPRLSTASSADGYARNYRARSFNATPTASSEASWNSQTGLLSNPPGAIPVSIRNPALRHEKKKSSSTKWILCRKCPCAGKKSVQVEDKQPESRTSTAHQPNTPKEPRNVERQVPEKTFDATEWLERQNTIPNSRRISAESIRFPPTVSQQRLLAPSIRPFSTDVSNGFTFPILNQTSPPMKLTLNGHTTPQLEDPARDSLEVFKPSEAVSSSKTTMESFIIPTSPKSQTTTMDDDIASDASSDLFEIESFSTQTTYHLYNSNRRDSLEEMNGRRIYCRHSLDETSMTPSAQTECYEPSEASIDWSVTTAEAFERGSVTNFSITASEVDQEFGVISQSDILKRNYGDSGKKRGSSGGGGGLLSCRHEKAVSVGPQPVKWGPNNTMRHVSSRPPIAGKPQLARSNSARLPLSYAPQK